MKKVLSIFPILILLVAVNFPQTTLAKDYSCRPLPATFFEPGETVFVELHGFDFTGISTLKAVLTSDEVNAEWLGYCANKELICIKIPSSGQIELERTLKQTTRGFKFHSSSAYSLTDSCFVTE